MPLLRNKNVVVSKIDLISADGKTRIDVRQIVKEFTIYEDMFTSSLSGSCLLSSSVAIEELLPIIGQDRISVEFRSEDASSTISLVFVIYKLSNIKQTSDRSQIMTVDFMTIEGIQNAKTKVSKYFDKEFTENVRSIYSTLESKKQLVIKSQDINRFKDKILVPNWTPFYAINFLANRSMKIASGNKATNYIFYEKITDTGNGSEYIFGSLDTIMGSAEIKKVYIKLEANVQEPIAGENDSKKSKLASNNVEKYQLNTAFDYLADLAAGTLAGTIIAPDITRKRWNKYTQDYFTDFKSSASLESNSNVAEGQDERSSTPADSSIFVMPKHKGLFARKLTNGDVESEESSHLEETSWRRNSFMQKFGDTKCTIRVAGDSSLRVGDVVQWKIPAASPMITEQKKYSRYLENKWLITSIAHTVNDAEGYTQNIEMVKDSLVFAIPKTNLFDILKRIADTFTNFARTLF